MIGNDRGVRRTDHREIPARVLPAYARDQRLPRSRAGNGRWSAAAPARRLPTTEGLICLVVMLLFRRHHGPVCTDPCSGLSMWSRPDRRRITLAWDAEWWPGLWRSQSPYHRHVKEPESAEADGAWCRARNLIIDGYRRVVCGIAELRLDRVRRG